MYKMSLANIYTQDTTMRTQLCPIKFVWVDGKVLFFQFFSLNGVEMGGWNNFFFSDFQIPWNQKIYIIYFRKVWLFSDITYTNISSAHVFIPFLLLGPKRIIKFWKRQIEKILQERNWREVPNEIEKFVSLWMTRVTHHT